MRYFFIAFEAIIFGLAAIYTYRKSGSLITFYKGDPTKRYMRVIRGVVALGVGCICANLRHTSSMVALHGVVVFGVLDLAACLLRLILCRKKESRYYKVLHKIYRCGLVPVLMLALILNYGFSNMWHIREKYYSVFTVKQIQNYRIALLTDLHYDTIQDKDVVREMVGNIQKQKPDLVILGGDIVEEGTSKESMEEIFATLGQIKSTYGNYYVYGNHDRQPYTTERTYTDAELDRAIERNGFQILKDRYVEIGHDLILAGRDDAAWGNTSGRKSAKEILQGLSAEDREEKYIIMVDHQPIEVDENGAEGVDLELSGHTHAGQIWPIGYFTEMAGTLNYGMYLRGQCRVIVSSGVAGWGYSFRTQEHCEYVMLQLQQQ